MAEKMTKKELRQPDTLQRVGLEAQSWLHERQRAVGIAVLVVLGVGLVAAIASYVSDRGEAQAQLALGAALRPLERPVREVAAGTTPPAGEDPPFPTQGEKDEAVVKSLSDFRAAHPDRDAAITAALPLAQAQHRLGRYDEALASYELFLKAAKPDDPLRGQALEGKGYAHEAKGQLDEALATFDRLASEQKGAFLKGMGLYHRARILEAQGKKEEAAKVLSDLQAQDTDTAAARMARERLSLLAIQGVAIPAAPTAGPDAGTQG